MSLEEGAINYTDLSPNANIQGHQIADKTLALRNLSDDTFGIVNIITQSVTKTSNSTGGILATLPHGLTTVPAIIGYVTTGGFYFPTEHLAIDASGVVLVQYYIEVDTTNLYLIVNTPNIVGGFYSSSLAITFKIYVLQETAN